MVLNYIMQGIDFFIDELHDYDEVSIVVKLSNL
jgi:hypothetical protein